VLRAKERAPTLSPSDVFTFRLVVESIKELGGASIAHILGKHFEQHGNFLGFFGKQ
jgi:hypothetical protein